MFACASIISLLESTLDGNNKLLTDYDTPRFIASDKGSRKIDTINRE